MGKSINIFTYGDSTKPSTWSNVPYCLSTTLEQLGYTINRIDISLSNHSLLNFYSRIWTAVARRVMAIRHKNDKFAYTFDRTPLFCKLVDRKIKKANQQYPDAWCNIFLSFSCYNKYSDVPSIMLCDWTFEHLIQEQYGRKPYPCEQRYIDIQNDAIAKCTHVVSLFEKSSEYIAKRTSNKNVVFLGNNVVNIVGDNRPNESTIKTKATSHNILFIGGYRYRQAAQQLVSAYNSIRQFYPDAKIDIIGQSEFDLGLTDNKHDGIRCHSYLDKADEKQRELYYKLINEASVLVNHNPVWGGYSSTIEAMMFYTPIVVAPYVEIVNEFGLDTPFISYCHQFTPDALVDAIRQVFDSSNRNIMSIEAHKAVEHYTWDSYTQKLIALIKNNK